MRAMVPEGGNEVSAMGDRAMAAAQQPGKGDGEAGAGKRLEPIRVLIADDHALFRRGLEMVLEEEDDIDLVGQASDGTEAGSVAGGVGGVAGEGGNASALGGRAGGGPGGFRVAGGSRPDMVLRDTRIPKTG